MSNFISNLADLNTRVLIPFLNGFFTENIGILFVGCAVILVVLGVLLRLVRTKL